MKKYGIVYKNTIYSAVNGIFAAKNKAKQKKKKNSYVSKLVTDWKTWL